MATPMMQRPRVRQETRVLVYNPSHLSDDVPVFGHYYHFPPRGVGQCTCANHAPDRPGGQPGDNQGCHAIYDWPRTEKNVLITSGAREIVSDAQRVADYIVSEECRGAKGFVILSGGAEEIAELKEAANANFVAFYMPHAESVIANWEASVADYRRTRPGDAAPRQPKIVREAYEFRDNYADVLPAFQQRRLPWVCNICGQDAETEAVLVAMCGKRHPAQTDYTNLQQPAPVAARPLTVVRPGGTPRAPAPLQPTGPQESPEDVRQRLGDTEREILEDATTGEQGDIDADLRPGLEPGLQYDGAPPPAPVTGAPRTPSGATMPAGILAAQERAAARNKAVAEGASLLDLASKTAGFPLSVADKKGLSHGDADVIADVKARMAEHKPAKAKKPEAEK